MVFWGGGYYGRISHCVWLLNTGIAEVPSPYYGIFPLSLREKVPLRRTGRSYSYTVEEGPFPLIRKGLAFIT